MEQTRQVVLIDADDTLWETNSNFERVYAAFADLVAPLGYTADFVRREVDRAEREAIRLHGYGARKFIRTLQEVYLKLAGHRAQDGEADKILRLSELLLELPPRLLDGVAETLAYLAPRHHLVLFTKGDAAEQAAKVDASGLRAHFQGCEIVPEKNAPAYRALVERHGWTPSRVWMVGNSPRSDINPALAAGLNAAFIPSALSWDYEHEEIRPGPGRLLRLQRFRDLRNHF